MILILGSVLLLSASGSVIIASGQVQVTDIRVLQGGDNGQCPSVEERERARNDIHQIVASVITTIASTTTMPSTTTLATTMPTTAAMTTMSSMTGTYTCYTCNGTPGWMRVTFINMTDTSYNCPTGFNLTSYSKRTCGRAHIGDGCSSTTFSVGGLPYSRVCGRIRGYQFGGTGAFASSSGKNIDDNYVEGISVTHGSVGNRQHIWTFAVGVSEVRALNAYSIFSCPCDSGLFNRIPAFVRNDYFCESGVHRVWDHNFKLYSNDTLWDGQGCISTSTCCQFNNPPWFTKNLSSVTTNDIELRMCINHLPRTGNIPLELIELYVQ